MLHRAANDFTTDGRNLMGVALKWNVPNRVTDDGGMTYYLEEFAPGSVTKTLKERAAIPLPLGRSHPWQRGEETHSIGDVWFRHSDEGLIFRAHVDETAEGDEVLAKVRSGDMKDVSVTFMPYKDEQRGDVTVRKEVGLMELSVARTGTGLHAGAEVLLVRSNSLTMSRKELEVRLAYLIRP